MKIYVDRMPTEPKECLFASKEKYLTSYTLDGKPVNLYMYYCNVNGKQCDLDNKCGKCNKLRVLMK